MKISADRLTAELKITGTFDAKQLDGLIRRLAVVRSEILPAVVATRDEISGTDPQVLMEDKPALVIAARRNGGFRLWLRHRGFGWLGYQIDSNTAMGMRDLINKHAGATKGVNLIEHDEPNRH